MGSFSVCEVWLLAQCLGSVRNWQAVGPFVRSNGLERRPVAPRNLARFSRWPGNPSPAAHDRTYFGQTASDISGWAWGLNPDDWVWQASRSPVASRPGTPGPRMDGLMDGETLSAKNAAYPILVPLFKEMACLEAKASRYAEALSELESCFRGGAGPEFRKAFRWKPPKSGLPGRGRNSSTEERRAWLDWDGSDGVSDRLKSQGAIFLNRWGRAFDETFRAVTNFRGHVKRCRELVERAADELRIVQGLAQGDPVVLVRRAINLLAASFPSEDDWAHETANGEANQWDKVSAPPEWKSALSSLRAAAWKKGTAARPVTPVTEAVAAEIARKILTQMPAASKEAPTPPKVSGYTRKELIDAVRIAIDRPDWSPSAFDNIRKAAGVKARARGGAGSFQRFTNAEIRDLAAAAETGVFRWGKQIGVALRELIHPPPLVTQSNHKL